MVDMRAEDDLPKALFSCFRLSYRAIFDRCCDRVNAPVEVIDDVAARIAAAVANFMVVI
jgi:benzoyl-CoA reductase/2-hydroxyglutaryl-CoA dehydratase subunit BcrC/BadD/HgdB